MLFSVLYLLLRRLLGRSDSAREDRDIELLVLRHQVKVLRRQVKQPALGRRDRLLLAAASRRLPRSLWSVFMVRPDIPDAVAPGAGPQEVDVQKDGQAGSTGAR